MNVYKQQVQAFKERLSKIIQNIVYVEAPYLRIDCFVNDSRDGT